MRIAIIGTGIAGNVAAYHLAKEHDIDVYEANSYIGGHTHTHQIEDINKILNIDTGFIVFNYKTYPEFTRLLETLDVPVQPSQMSFSVKNEVTGLEYNGTTLNTLFAQRRNLLRPAFYRMIKDIMRFNKEAPLLLTQGDQKLTLEKYLQENRYHSDFIEQYIIPMGSAIWSADPVVLRQMPAKFFIQFFSNHGMLSVNDRPQWYVIKGGSNQYLKKLTASYADKVRLNSPVISIKRYSTHVDVTAFNCETERYDAVFIASHSDQALKMLDDADTTEQQVLSAINYQRNEAVLHTDTSLLPKRPLAWAAWNYHVLPTQQNCTTLTYNMNILQSLNASRTYCVTLNHTSAIKESSIIKKLQYEHPVFTSEAVAAQQRQSEINGVRRTYYCGAYWKNGFHEDGVVSALQALQDFKEHQYAQLHIRRAG
jgi:predicted NAD/FAD-binding protein